MFSNQSGKNRLERIQEVVNMDYTNRHDAPFVNLQPGDLEWLTEQAKKAEQYKETLENIADEKSFDVGTLAEAREVAKQILKE